MLFLTYSPSLTSLDYVILQFINKHLEQIPTMPVREIAAQTHTSTASILRFCQKFECSGFTEFKIRTKLYLEQQNSQELSLPNRSEYIRFIQQMDEHGFLAKIEKAVKILMNKELVIFLGSGTSETIAEYGTLYFTNMSVPSLKITDPSNYSPDWFPNGMLSTVCFIVLSISGETHEILDYTQRLVERHATVLTISNSDDSPLAKLGDLNIPYYLTRETIPKNIHKSTKTVEITSQLPALLILETLSRLIHDEKMATN